MPRRPDTFPHIDNWVDKAKVNDEFIYPSDQINDAFKLYEQGKVMLFLRRSKVRTQGLLPFDRIAKRVTPEILAVFDDVSRSVPAPPVNGRLGRAA